MKLVFFFLFVCQMPMGAKCLAFFAAQLQPLQPAATGGVVMSKAAQPPPHACQCPAIAPSARSGLQAPQSGVMHPQWAQCPSWAQCAQCSCNAAKWAAVPRNAPKPVQCPQCPCKPHHARHGKPAGAVRGVIVDAPDQVVVAVLEIVPQR